MSRSLVSVPRAIHHADVARLAVCQGDAVAGALIKLGVGLVADVHREVAVVVVVHKTAELRLVSRLGDEGFLHLLVLVRSLEGELILLINDNAAERERLLVLRGL